MCRDTKSVIPFGPRGLRSRVPLDDELIVPLSSVQVLSSRPRRPSSPVLLLTRHGSLLRVTCEW